ncbi:MAG: hypothetical protein KA104_02330 [Candidatus Pacebacteria bacterium]|nr:hypothetical protein [Candidatus Paceibacterota bacterium]
MTTYINTPGEPTEPRGASTTGWVVAVVILVLIVVAGYFLWPKTGTETMNDENQNPTTQNDMQDNSQPVIPTINNTTFNSSTTINTSATTTTP